MRSHSGIVEAVLNEVQSLNASEASLDSASTLQALTTITPLNGRATSPPTLSNKWPQRMGIRAWPSGTVGVCGAMWA
jgi:hypothetical protein